VSFVAIRSVSLEITKGGKGKISGQKRVLARTNFVLKPMFHGALKQYILNICVCYHSGLSRHAVLNCNFLSSVVKLNNTQVL
jgi:hypothetical protein